jgi:hypothetical protein
MHKYQLKSFSSDFYFVFKWIYYIHSQIKMLIYYILINTCAFINLWSTHVVEDEQLEPIFQKPKLDELEWWVF